MNRINNNNYNKVSTENTTPEPLADSKRSFGQRVANVFASLVLQNNSADSAELDSRRSAETQTSQQTQHPKLRLTQSCTVKKSTSLERNINHRITEAEEQARRTRSLERNHRHLVTIDSSCRYVIPKGFQRIEM